MTLNSVAEPSFDLEENVIGSMMLNKKCFEKAVDKGLTPEDFSKYSFKCVYQIMIQKQTSDILLIKVATKKPFLINEQGIKPSQWLVT